MTKSDFVEKVASTSGLSKKDAGAAVDAVLESLEEALKSGDLAIVLACRPTAMLGLLQHDLGLVLADLGALATPVGAPFQVPATLVERLLSAVESQVEG